MQFIEQYRDPETKEWVLKYEIKDEEYAVIQMIEQELQMTLSEMVDKWLCRMILYPEEAKALMKSWTDGYRLREFLPTISVKELQDHIEDDNFFQVYGNPVVVKCDGYPDCVVMSIEYMERLREIIDEAEKAVNAIAVMMCTEDYRKYWEEREKNV